jgi:hypothetical protein
MKLNYTGLPAGSRVSSAPTLDHRCQECERTHFGQSRPPLVPGRRRPKGVVITETALGQGFSKTVGSVSLTVQAAERIAQQS